MKLNVGAGGRRLDGYTGVDVVERSGADIIAPAHKIPLPDGSVEEIMAIHVFEHFYRWEVDSVIREWKRLLQPGGRLVLELPDIIKCAQNILDGRVKGGKDPDQLGMWGAYGDPGQCDPHMNHRWGWSPKSLRAFLSEHGFIDIADEETKFHPAGRQFRDMRITARKP